MDEGKVLNNVLSKLTSLRGTMAEEEQQVLDGIVSRAGSMDDEVSAHVMTTKSTVSKGLVTKGLVTKGIIYDSAANVYRLIE
jgi:hypothetical protein